MNDSTIVVVEEQATFPGGMQEWNYHLRKNLKYPVEAKRYGYQGDVHLTYVVLADGRIAAVRVIESPHSSLTDEALRMLRISPRWIPGKYGGIPVDSQMKLRIAFRLR